MRLALSGSAPLSTELVRAFSERTGIEVHQGYGLTEAAPVVTSPAQRAPASRARSAPRCPASRSGSSTRPGATPEGEDAGEIHVRGANLFTGCWPDGADGPDAEGWYATGDVGFLDGDGDLFLVDRLKELVIVSGFNVYPTEVEEVVTELDGVAEAAVIGVPHPRDRRGGGRLREAGARVDVRRGGAGAAGRATHCAVRLARFKRPRRGARRRPAAAHRHREGGQGPAAGQPAPGLAGCWAEPA